MTLLFAFLLGYAFCSDISLTINCHYPDDKMGKSDILFIRGDGLGLSSTEGMEMTKKSESWWVAELQGSFVSELEFKILKNDESYQLGHFETIKFEENEEDDQNVDVSVYPFFEMRQGSYEVLYNFFSPELNNTRNISIYLPPSFYENDLKKVKNILIMHDGQSLFDPATAPSWSPPWWCQNVSDELIIDGEIEEYMIIAPWCIEDMRTFEFTYSMEGEYGGGGDLYLDYLEDTMLPEVIKFYGEDRFEINEKKMGILGSSLGGLISCYAGWTRYEVYKKVGCMSSSFWWNNEDFITDVIKNNELEMDDDTVFYIDTGTVLDCYNSTMDTKEVLDEMEQFVTDENYFFYLDEGAAHTGYYWGRRFHRPLSYFYSPDPLDKNVSYTPTGDGEIIKANLILVVILALLTLLF